jgi:DNA-directed RNA polymerase subunit RPC12/RpoP
MTKAHCQHCGHDWNYTGVSEKPYISCPACLYKVPNPDFKNPKGDD